MTNVAKAVVAGVALVLALAPVHAIDRESRTISGWSVHVDKELLARDADATAKALRLLEAQLNEIVRTVPAKAVEQLKKVPLWLSPEYAGVGPRAEYHPDAGWLRDNGRDPAMAKGVEFTNVRIFEAEMRRMPNFALHELAHAFHDRVLGFDEPRIVAAYRAARETHSYDRVQRQDSEGKLREDKAYAMTDHKEYFAECTEAFFSRNDFFPFTAEELKRHDPKMTEVLTAVWGGGKGGPAAGEASK